MSTTTDLSTLKINYLTQAQYDTALANDEINENELYMTPANNCPYQIGDIYVTTKDYSLTTEGNPSAVWPGTYWEQIQDTFLLAAGTTYSAGGSGGEATHRLTDEESGMRGHTHVMGTHYHTLSSHTHEHNHYHNPNTESYFLTVESSPSNARFNISSSGARYTVGYTSADKFHGRSATGNIASGSTTTTGTPSNNWTSTLYSTKDTTSTAGSTNGADVVSGLSDHPYWAKTAHNNMPPYLTVYMWKRVATDPNA